MSFSIKHKGDFSKTEKFFNKLLKKNYLNIIDEYGRLGLAAIRQATPRDSGITSDSWDYEIIEKKESVELIFINNNKNGSYNIAILLQYGHGTRNGGYVEGIDYINPALRPIFKRLADRLWEEVTKD